MQSGLQEKRELLEETFGSTAAMGMDEFITNYKLNGTEPDNRREVVESLAHYFENIMMPRLLTYFRDIPGFAPLRFQDVLLLIKSK